MPQSRSNILFVSHSAALGGAERCLLSLVEGLDRDRFNPIVAVPGNGPLSERLDKACVQTRVTPLRWWLGIRSNSRARRILFARGLQWRVEALASLIRKNAVDIVVSNTLVILEGALAARMTGRRHVWHALEMLGQDPDLRPLLPLGEFYAMLDDMTDAVVAVSEGVAAELRPHLGRADLRIIHTGIRAEGVPPARGRKRELFGFPEETPVVSYVGLLSSRKGVLDLARAAKLVAAAHPNARFLFAGGEGGVGTDLRQWIDGQGLSSRVRLLGFRRDALDVLANSDVFVLPALADPLPVSVLEAMSVGTPVVATRSGGCSEMVVDGETGFLVAVNDPEALAGAIDKMLNDPDRARRMGRAGQSRAHDLFQVSQNVRGFEDLFEAMSRPNTDKGPSIARAAVDRILSAIERECGGLVPTLGALGIRGRECLSRTPLRGAYRFTRSLVQRAGLS